MTSEAVYSTLAEIQAFSFLYRAYIHNLYMKTTQQDGTNISFALKNATAYIYAWTASINLHAIICNDNVNGAPRRKNVAGKIHLELLSASPQDDSAGAPVVSCYLNSHVGQMIRSATKQHKHTPGEKKKTEA